MRFQVPQFIEVEDKIFGPLTFKQFIYLAGGAGISFTLYTLLPKFIAFILIILVLGFSAALAFYTKNNKPFIYVLESAFKYWTSSKLYIWKKETKKIKEKEEVNIVSQLNIPRLSDSKLKELSWELDIQDSPR
ncbi:MAG: PrgI family protein [Candidatus Pacebacteria bacterium]|nr:PrgI family protein [Candidatus Paceibacterota bacterium]